MQLLKLLISTKERKGNMFDSDRYNVAISIACSLLNVDKFYPEQKEALWNFFNGKDVLFSAHTGYGKSLIYQAMPIIADVLKNQAIGTSTVLVLSPLISLMKDQVQHINNSFSISAAAIFDGQEEEILQNIEDNANSLIYASPECFVGKNVGGVLQALKHFVRIAWHL